jgi:hypothetical protein
LPSPPALVVTPLPPDQVKGERRLGFYLYHIREEAHTKSQDWPDDDPRPQRLRPMGLALYYVLTPHCETADDAATASTSLEQTLMGLAMKTLRDYARIDATTTVLELGNPLPQFVMADPLRKGDNVLRIQLMPIQNHEAPEYWTAGTSPLRLSAYYEATAVLLDPDVETSRRSRVLAYGVHTFVRGSPRIDGTRNVVTFTIPSQPTARQVELQPAEVTYGDAFEVFGSDLKGDRTALLIRHRSFAAPVEVDSTWALTTNGSVLSATIQTTAGAQSVAPGIYGAIVKTVARRTLPDGTVRDFELFSNESGFAITPKITGTTLVAVGNSRIDGLGLDPANLTDPADVDLVIGAERLTRRIPPAALNAAGQFRVQPGPPAFIQFRFPTTLASGSVVSMRLIIRGAESAPLFVTVP